MIIAIMAMAIIIIFCKPSNKSDMCEVHRKLFNDSFSSGIVTEKFIDKNHAERKIRIKTKNTIYLVRFIPYSNWSDFAKINIGDTLCKHANTFAFKINGRDDFILGYDCSYLK